MEESYHQEFADVLQGFLIHVEVLVGDVDMSCWRKLFNAVGCQLAKERRSEVASTPPRPSNNSLLMQELFRAGENPHVMEQIR